MSCPRVLGSFLLAFHWVLHGSQLTAGLLQVIIRDHSYYSQALYDAIMAEWEPLTDQDILVISYGGWYPRFVWQSDQVWTCACCHVAGPL